MKKLIIPIVAAAMLLGFTECGKGGGGGGGCNETAMTVASIPAANSTEPASPGPDFPVQVNITANKPAGGVNIEVKAREESKTTFFYNSGVVSSNSNTNNFTITGTPSTVVCVVEITVTSKSCATNKVSLTYKYSKK
jgi:hypothetical protein